MDIEEYSKYKQSYNDEIPDLLNKYFSKKDVLNYLDLGCGDGVLLNALNKKGYFENKKVYAVDLSENRINLVKEINKKFVCLVSDACNVSDIKENSIDFLVSSQVIEHVKNDEIMIKEIYRMLKKDGIAYISTVFKKKYAWYFYRCNGQWVLDPTHVREYTNEDQLFGILERNNFKIIESRKTLIKRSVLDFSMKRIGVKKETKILNIPILGYYNWEIVCKKI